MDLHAATIVAYRTVGIASDRLPYSPNMRRFRDCLRALGHDLDDQTAWRTLRDLRKRRLLPQLGRGPNNRESLPPAKTLVRLLAEMGTSIDRLPYSAAMDQFVRSVRNATAVQYTYWQVWWGLLNARKRVALR